MEHLTELLQQLATELGTTTKYLWEVLLAQAQVALIQNLLWLVLMLLYIGFAWKINGWLETNYKQKQEKLGRFDNNWWVLPWVFHCVFTVVFIVTVILIINSTITLLINPEYWALQKILYAI